MNPKPFYQSKTVWFNVIMSVILIAELIHTVLPDLQDEWKAATLLVMGVGNIVLRVWFTDSPVTLKKQ